MGRAVLTFGLGTDTRDLCTWKSFLFTFYLFKWVKWLPKSVLTIMKA